MLCHSGQLTLSCPKSTIDTRSGDVSTHQGSVVDSVAGGFLAVIYKDANPGIQLINKDDGSVIWEFAGGNFGEVLDDHRVLAAVFGGGKVTKTMVLDTATGKPTIEYAATCSPAATCGCA